MGETIVYPPGGSTVEEPAIPEAPVLHGNTGAAETIDVMAGKTHIATQDQACAYTFTAPPDDDHEYSFMLVLTSVTGAATWPASVDWPSATAPTLTGKCVLVFTTYDAGVTWLGFLSGAGMG